MGWKAGRERFGLEQMTASITPQKLGLKLLSSLSSFGLVVGNPPTVWKSAVWCGQWELDLHGPSWNCCALDSEDVTFCHVRVGLSPFASGSSLDK